MSRSNPNSGSEKPTNPAELFLQWDSDNKQFKYWDKEAKKNVLVPLPVKFLVLDTLATVTGFNEATEQGIWSNEVKNVTKDSFTVMTKKGVEGKGLWNDVKTKVSGAKFASSVYAAYLAPDKTIKLVNFKMSGSSLNTWIEFLNPDKKSGNTKPNILKNGVIVKTSEDRKKGRNNYSCPIFSEVENIPDDINEKAAVLDATLQAYLSEYFAYVKQFDKEENVAESTQNTELELVKKESVSASETKASRGSVKMEDAGEVFVNNGSDLPSDFDLF